MRFRTALVCFVAVLFLVPLPLRAHCDAIGGPVVADAKKALESGDVTPVLKWLRSSDESEARKALSAAVAVRKGSDEARELADRWFFETVVRLHRASEGEPYEGLKSGPNAIAPALVEADKALAEGDGEELIRHLSAGTAKLLRERYAAVKEARKTVDSSVEAGRRYVESYVACIHLVEQLSGGNHAEQAH